MLKTDVARLTALASDDEAVRLGAAQALEALPWSYFSNHRVDPGRLPAGWLEAMVAAWHATGDALVRAWIAQAVALARLLDARVPAPVMLEFLDIEGRYYYDVARSVLIALIGKPHARERLMALHRHPDPKVRSLLMGRLAHGIAADGFDWAVDAPIVRRLMLDPDMRVRNDAVAVAASQGTLGPEDVGLLLDVVNMDNRDARVRALAILETLPASAREAAAPRVPLLRMDGRYHTLMTGLDPGGRWMTRHCLRFLPDGRVLAYGAAGRDFRDELAHPSRIVESGTFRKEGADVGFTLAGIAGPVDYAGRIDGSRIRFKRIDHSTGREDDINYEYAFVDWDAPPPPVVPSAKPRGKAAEPLPFERVQPDSLTMADAAKWYLLMVARLPLFLDGVQGDDERFRRAWFLRNEMRAAAGKSLFDPNLKGRLFDELPLPDAAAMLAAHSTVEALRALVTVTPQERRAFLDGLWERVGATHEGVDGVYVMTEEGWQLR